MGDSEAAIRLAIEVPCGKRGCCLTRLCQQVELQGGRDTFEAEARTADQNRATPYRITDGADYPATTGRHTLQGL